MAPVKGHAAAPTIPPPWLFGLTLLPYAARVGAT